MVKGGTVKSDPSLLLRGNVSRVLPSLREYCVVVAQTVTSAILGVELPLGDPKIEAMIDDLQQEFIDNYAENGMPYGENESDLVSWLLDNVTISTE